MRLLSLARQLKYRTSASAAAAGGASDNSPAQAAGGNPFMNPATSGAPIITSTVVIVRILHTFICSSPFFPRVTALSLHNGKLRATERRRQTARSGHHGHFSLKRHFIL